VLGIAVATTLAGCGGSTAPTGTASPYVIHAVLAETGTAAFLGTGEVAALRALTKQVNDKGGIDGHPIQMDIADNQSSPATAVSVAQPWVSSGVPFILNGSVVATNKAVDALATSAGPFIYDLSPGTHPTPGSMIFSAGLSTTFDAAAYLTFLKSKGLTNIAAITSTDGSGIDGFSQLQAALRKPEFSSFHLLTHQAFDPTAVSVTTQLSVIKAANPQALIIWTTGTPLGVVLNGMLSLGMESIPTVTTDGNASSAELKHFASILPQQIFFPTGPLYVPASQLPEGPVKSAVSTFDSAVSSGQGVGGDAWGLAWDPAQLLIGAIKHLGVSATAPQILDYMQNLKDVPGVFGTYNTTESDHRGLAVEDVYISSWNGTTFVPKSGPGGTPMAG